LVLKGSVIGFVFNVSKRHHSALRHKVFILSLFVYLLN